MTNYNKTKSTKRFTYGIASNPTAKKAGSNRVTISTNSDDDGRYSTSSSSLTMTFKEAKVLQSFLNTNFIAE